MAILSLSEGRCDRERHGLDHDQLARARRRAGGDPNADPVAQLATTSETLRKIFLDLGPL
jgi:hypothetical protein